MNAKNLSEPVKLALRVAQALAREYRQAVFTPAHLLKGLLHPETGLARFLTSVGKDTAYIADWAEVRIEEQERTSAVKGDIMASPEVKRIIDESDHIRIILGLDLIIPVCVLSALCKPGLAFTPDQLKSFPIKDRELLDLYIMDEEISMLVSTQDTGTSSTKNVNMEQQGTALFRYCIDRIALARDGKTDPIIGRDAETRMMMETLCRRIKPNVMLIGEAGVGKTALVDGFSHDVIAGNVPPLLKDIRFFELDLGALIAGASYKGEIEERLKKVLKEIKQCGKALLFIDEIHTLLDSKSPIGSGIGNLLKPELARGELTVIGATTNGEFRKFIEPDHAFTRRFELLSVAEPGEAVAIRMIQKLAPVYEKHHHLAIGENVIGECVQLAKRYMKDRRLPDSALDLLDRSLAAVRMMNDTSEATVKLFNEAYENMNASDHHGAEDEYSWLYHQFTNKLSPILLAQLESINAGEEIDKSEDPRVRMQHTLNALNTISIIKRNAVRPGDIAAIVSHKTNIPLGKIQTREKDKLLNLESYLKRRVIGQDHALSIIAGSILQSRSGLNKKGQPIGSFFLAGPTGTGKTELAKSIAEFLFNDERAMIRFDMSEFKEEHSAALLYGAPPGYVGYEEGGLLVNKIRQQPYAVILFDEIEKAHPSVFDTFLQILDEGVLHDRLGNEGDFSNALVLFTSNIGSSWITGEVENSRIPSPASLIELMSAHFRPEFLARLSEIVPFLRISGENIIHIFKIQLRNLSDLLHQQGIVLDVSDEAVLMLAAEGYDPKYGARQLSTIIRNRLSKPISRMIIAEELCRGQTLMVTTDNAELEFTVTETTSFINL